MNKTERPVWLEIDLDAVRANLVEVRRLAGARQVIASVKGNAYGFGVVEIVRSLAEQDVQAFWTGNVDEAIRLRLAGIQQKIILFGGYLPSQIAELVGEGLIPTIYDSQGLAAAALVGAQQRRPVTVYVKVDSGLGRLGVSVDEALGFVQRISREKFVSLEGIYTHLPFKSAAERDWACMRHEKFAQLIAALRKLGITPPVTQVWGSSGVLAGLPDSCNAVCVGHLLFGLPALKADVPALGAFKFALKSIKAPLIHVSESSREPNRVADGYGYGGVSNARVKGVVPFGLGDGMRRLMPGKTLHALVRGHRVPVLGTSLEHTVLGLDAVEQPQVGEDVVLVGSQGEARIGFEELADAIGCSPLDTMMSLSGHIRARYVRESQTQTQSTPTLNSAALPQAAIE